MVVEDPLLFIILPIFVFILAYEAYRKAKGYRTNQIRSLGVLFLVVGIFAGMILHVVVFVLMFVVGIALFIVGGQMAASQNAS